MMLFDQGPPLCTTLTFQEGKFIRSTLSPAPQFTCRFLGDTDTTLKNSLLHWLKCYGQKKSTPLALDLENLTPFRERVLKTLQNIPFGETITYGELSTLSGHLKAARAVGSACHFNPFPLFIPCHRVIAAQGKLGGFAYDLTIKSTLLEFEDHSSSTSALRSTS
jgi:O-6-methylguanine DNA methyltransferase